MNKFDYAIDEEIAILDKYNLTPDELFVAKCILLLQNEDSSYLVKFLQIQCNKNKFHDTLVSLQNKGIILKSWNIPNKGESFNPNDIKVSANFSKTLWKSSYDMGKELFTAYPMFGEINGRTVTLRGVASKFNSLEDFFRFYGKSIRWNLETHRHILELINWEQSNNIGFLNQSIANFVINQGWHELEALKNGKVANINFNAIEQL